MRQIVRQRPNESLTYTHASVSEMTFHVQQAFLLIGILLRSLFVMFRWFGTITEKLNVRKKFVKGTSEKKHAKQKFAKSSQNNFVVLHGQAKEVRLIGCFYSYHMQKNEKQKRL